MNRKSVKIFLLGLLLVGLIVGFWLWGKRLPDTSQPESQIIEQATNLPAANPVTQIEEPPKDSLLSNQIKQFIADRDSTLNGAVEFYGRVIDQNDQPVSDVAITGEYSYYVTTEFSGNAAVKNIQQKSAFLVKADANGFFSLQGIRGINVLFLTFEKEGLVLADKQSSGYNFAKRYGNVHHADPKQPVIFRMWRKGKTEPLIYVENKVSLEPHEAALSFNWLTGESWAGTNASADVVLHMERQHSAEVAWFVQQWTMTIVALGTGGLQETSDPHLKFLPESGFKNVIQYDSRSVQQQGWSGSGGTQLNYFLRVRDGRLTGAVKADIAVGNNGAVTFRYAGYFNPTGSKMLEPDSEKLITDAEEIRRVDELTKTN